MLGGGGLAQNVYEWEADGTGACVQPSGCVFLISDGLDRTEVFYNSSVKLLGADGSGENVFFTTDDQLVASDTDTEFDIYDARVDGGFPAAKRETSCEGEGCRAGSSEASVSRAGSRAKCSRRGIFPRLNSNRRWNTLDRSR